ncbi:hypothetical protein SEPCBS57363_003358 [Sporothrix epigloea]|uniref:Het-s domain containing protein n=1 Tax=Sporothrix epigloea TaxID=1892477 RepID=A0ABP0DL17_9PEZI
MDSYFLPGIQMSFQRNLSRLYNDTKKSSDFVKETVQNAEDPEIKALHRKLRIQKDRLVSWGLEWSDPGQSSEVLIDSSLSRAGLSEVVSSIMSTIKETLAEVEPLWLSSKRLVSGSTTGATTTSDSKAVDHLHGSASDLDRDRKLPTVTWDKVRFADLVRDLTISIDTLYDLSRTRSSAATAGSTDFKHASMPGSFPSSGHSANNNNDNVPYAPSGKLHLITPSTWSPSSFNQLHMQQSQQRRVQQQQHQQQHEQQQQLEYHQHSPQKHGQLSSSTVQLTKQEAQLFESSRMLVPQQIDSAMLTTIESSTLPPEDPKVREVVFMNKQAYAELVARPLGTIYAPLLLEYAYFDPVYSSTGIMPSMARFEKLSAGLQGEAGYGGGNPRLLGYFEDMDHARLGLVYQFPPGFHAIASTSAATQSPELLRSCLYSLGDLLGSPDVEPKLEAKFRLASNLANAVFELHAKGIVHGNLIDASILFGRLTNLNVSLPASDVSQVDIRRPLIASHDLFPGTPSPASKADIRRRSSRLHQHPLNPISFAPGAPPIVDADPRVFDLYSLAMLLLSIGMWTRLENLVPHQDSAMVSEAVLDQLATQCGTLYMKAVQTCWNAMELVVSAGKAAGESHLARLQVRASSYLEACCVLDDVAKLDERLRDDLGGDDDIVASVRNTVPKASSSASISDITSRSSPAPFTPPSLVHSHSAPPLPPPKTASAALVSSPQPTSMRTRRSLLPMPERGRFPDEALEDSRPPPVPPKTNTNSGGGSNSASSLGFALPLLAGSAAPADSTEVSEVVEAPIKEKEAKPRMRLYPQVALPADVVEKWHTYLMPQINYALRHFYRSHPESVEISLESVGDSPRNTRPTVVVVCTSVSKVRSILKRKMGTVFEGTNGVGLKVCTGRVMRSRKDASAGDGVHRSQGGGNSHPTDVSAANSQFQQKPQNGASIGAWIGDRHLPPVSFGGLVLVDDKPFGMTVHHMLDDPDAAEAAAAREGQKTLRSSGAAAGSTLPTAAPTSSAEVPDDNEDEEIEELGRSVLDWYAELQANSSAAGGASVSRLAGRHSSGSEIDDNDHDEDGDDDDDFACEFSDTSSTVSETDITSEWSDSDDEDHGEEDGSHSMKVDEDFDEPGDVPGVEPGYGEGYIVTQPALDDVDGNFYPDEATQDDDHLDSCSLGDVYASSGVRRRVDEHGLVHEIDWALFEFKAERQPRVNSIPHLPLAGSDVDAGQVEGTLRPTTVAPATALPGLEVQCLARTSGLQTGRILPTITSVKLYGRTSPSHTYQIAAALADATRAGNPIGIPGDSGAWIVEREHGRLCGHVLAWSARKRVAYLCPMDVLLLDIAETLEAGEVRLPGGDAVVKIMDAEKRKSKEPAHIRGGWSQGSGSRRGSRRGSRASHDSYDGHEQEGNGQLPMLSALPSKSPPLHRHEQWTDRDTSSVAMSADIDEGFQDSDAATLAGSATSHNSSRHSGACGRSGPRWQESTKMMEMVGSMSKVRMASSNNAQGSCYGQCAAGL